jgi:hypothetical protein
VPNDSSDCLVDWSCCLLLVPVFSWYALGSKASLNWVVLLAFGI